MLHLEQRIQILQIIRSQRLFCQQTRHCVALPQGQTLGPDQYFLQYRHEYLHYLLAFYSFWCLQHLAIEFSYSYACVYLAGNRNGERRGKAFGTKWCRFLICAPVITGAAGQA